MIHLFGFAAVAFILATYAYMIRTDKEALFHWANAIGFIPIGLSAYMQRAWPSLVITTAFGIIGAVGVWHTLRLRRGNAPQTYDAADVEWTNIEGAPVKILGVWLYDDCDTYDNPKDNTYDRLDLP